MRNYSDITDVSGPLGCVPTSLIGVGVLLGLLWFLLSCSRQEGYVYTQTISLEQGQWSYADTALFSFSVSDTSLRYNLYLEVEHADTFAYQNVYVQLHTSYPDGRQHTQVLPLDLFDAQGQSNGRCSGGLCRVEFVLQERAILPQQGRYTIAVEQYMRSSPVSGIRELRLTVRSAL